MFHKLCRTHFSNFFKNRNFSNLPIQHKIDGTRWDRIPYPLYARRVIYISPFIIGGLIGTTVYFDPEFPENPNSEVVKDMFRRGFIVSTSLLITFPIILVVMKTRVNWIWRQKVQYISTLLGSCAYFKYGEMFPKSEFCTELAPMLAVIVGVLSAALLAPFSNNGWIVCSLYSSLMTFIISCYFSNNYLQGILFDKEVSNWNSELKERIASRQSE